MSGCGGLLSECPSLLHKQFNLGKREHWRGELQKACEGTGEGGLEGFRFQCSLLYAVKILLADVINWNNCSKISEMQIATTTTGEYIRTGHFDLKTGHRHVWTLIQLIKEPCELTPEKDMHKFIAILGFWLESTHTRKNMN